LLALLFLCLNMPCCHIVPQQEDQPDINNTMLLDFPTSRTITSITHKFFSLWYSVIATENWQRHHYFKHINCAVMNMIKKGMWRKETDDWLNSFFLLFSSYTLTILLV
jgi:hypothetical protein